jgi:hypothetical protein
MHMAVDMLSLSAQIGFSAFCSPSPAMSGSTSTSGSSGLGSAEIVVALSAVIRAEELPAIAELRLELERKSMVAEDATASTQRDKSTAAQRYQALMRDARAIADEAADAGVHSDLVAEYAHSMDSCWACGRLVLSTLLERATPSVEVCRSCMEQLRARGWRASGGVCACGVDIGMGSIGGRRRCMHCALQFVRHRRRA